MPKPLIYSLCKISDTGSSDVVWMAGVCAGIAYTFGIPVWMVRLFFIVVGLVTGFVPLFVIYVLLAVLLPSLLCPDDFYEKTQGIEDNGD